MKRFVLKKSLTVATVFISLFVPVFVSAEELSNFGLLKVSAGTVEGTGTHFSITGSEYLNVTLDSTKTIKLKMESVPETVTLMIEPVSVSSSTQLAFVGFQPNTRYYLYQDNYHNLTELTTNENGVFSYAQDLSTFHIVFIQPTHSTRFIKDDATGGDCAKGTNPIGTWNILTKTCILNTDLLETIQIDNDNIILDGNGKTLTGYGTGNGIFLSGVKGVTIKNLIVKNFTWGVHLWYSSNNNLSSNTALDNFYDGILLDYSDDNIISNNVVNSQYPLTGIEVYTSNNNILFDNIVSNVNRGFSLGWSNNNVLRGNTILNNKMGISVDNANDNKIYRNNFITNIYQAFIFGNGQNLLNLPSPIGGNYWDSYDEVLENCNNVNNDNFCDAPYILPYMIDGGQDNLPWMKKDGWIMPVDPIVSNLEQYKMLGTDAIAESATFVGNTAVMKAKLSDPANGTVKMEVEIKKTNQSFDGTNTHASDYVASNNVASITINDLIPKDDQYTAGGNVASFHWRARAVSTDGKTSDWQEFGTAGNTDFTVKVVALWTQKFSPFPSEEKTRLWASENYGKGYYSDCLTRDTKISTIARCGCLITSLVMVGRYYGLENGVDGKPIDPLNINNWLYTHGGYTVPGETGSGDKGGNLKYPKEREYLGTQLGSYFTVSQYNAKNSVAVQNAFETNKPIIAWNADVGHWFIVDSKLGTSPTYTMKDPLWYKTKTLNENQPSESEKSVIHAYGNIFSNAKIYTYNAVPKKLSSLTLTLGSPAELVVIDPNGHKIGKNPETGVLYEEIPDAQYFSEENISSSDEILPDVLRHENKFVIINDPLPGDYMVQVIGTGEGVYTISALTYDTLGESHDVIRSGNIAIGDTDTLMLEFNPENLIDSKFDLTQKELIELLKEKIEKVEMPNGTKNSTLQQIELFEKLGAQGNIKTQKVKLDVAKQHISNLLKNTSDTSGVEKLLEILDRIEKTLHN